MPGCSGDEVPYRSREYEKRLSDVFPTDEGRGCVCPLHSSGEERRYKLNDFNEADACDSGALHGFLHGVRPAGRGVARTCGGGLVARLAATDRILYRRCEKLLIGEDTLAARALFLQALELDSAYAPAWFRLSSVTPDGDPQGTAWARRAYRLDSLNKWYGQLYGQKLLAEGELDKARPLFVRLSALDPTNPDNIRILAILYQQAGMPYSAIDMLDSAEMRFGKMPLLGAMKRQLLIRTGQLDRALAEAREMAEAIPYEAENHVILADLYGAAKQDSLAIAEYNRALEIDSMNVPALASLAEFYNKRNDSHAYLAVSKRLFEIDELPLSEKVRIFRQLTLDVRFTGTTSFSSTT